MKNIPFESGTPVENYNMEIVPDWERVPNMESL
jgi:hypothetical protein